VRIRDRISEFRLQRIVKRVRAQRDLMKRDYGDLFDEVSALLFKADPIGINFESNTDEYDPEASTIIPRLRKCANAEQVCTVVFEEFVRWFSVEDAGAPERYREVSAQIWDAWRRFQGERA
jgi:hypothetical protein